MTYEQLTDWYLLNDPCRFKHNCNTTDPKHLQEQHNNDTRRNFMCLNCQYGGPEVLGWTHKLIRHGRNGAFQCTTCFQLYCSYGDKCRLQGRHDHAKFAHILTHPAWEQNNFAPPNFALTPSTYAGV